MAKNTSLSFSFVCETSADDSDTGTTLEHIITFNLLSSCLTSENAVFIDGKGFVPSIRPLTAS